MDEGDFQRGALSIRYLEDHPDLMEGEEEEAVLRAAAVAAALLEEGEMTRLRTDLGSRAGQEGFSPWRLAGRTFGGRR